MVLEKTPESPLDCKEIKPVHPNGNQPEYSLERLMLKLQYSGHVVQRVNSLEKTLILGKTEGQRRRGLAKDEMVGWHRRLKGHEPGQTPAGETEGQGSLACCSPWGRKESDRT